jgi:hypothetical protein
MNGGMITMYEPSAIPDGAGQVVQNMTVRFNRTQRRVGTVTLNPAKPDANRVLAMYFFKDLAGTPYTYRLTNLTIFQLTGSAWVSVPSGVVITGAPLDPLAGGNFDYFTIATLLSRIIVTNNGVNEVIIIDPAAGKYGALSLSTGVFSSKFRFVTVFYNRVILANLAGSDEITVAWSGDGNFSIFDPSVDETAGFQDLLESPADATDFISGVFGYTNMLVVIREQSIWLATKQLIPQNPFNFFAAVPGIGCNCPYSITQVLGGLAWADQRTGTVWFYQVGGVPQPIGRPVERTLMSGINDPKQVFGSYDPIQNEYHICIPQVGSPIIVVWTYNFRTETWTYNQYNGVSCMDNTTLAIGGIEVQQLVGTVAGLTGTVAGLSPSDVDVISKQFGTYIGDVWVENVNAYNDGMVQNSDGTIAQGTGVQYTSLFTSKAYEDPERYIYIREVRIEFIQIGGGSMQLQIALDGGVNEQSWMDVEDVFVDNIGFTNLLRYQDNLACRRFAWRCFIEGGAFEIIAHEVHHYIGGISLD